MPSPGMPPHGKISQSEYENLVREGVVAAKDGRRKLAQRLLTRASRLNPLDPRPWLWLTDTTDDLEEKYQYLERALACDPGNTMARTGVRKLARKLGKPVPEIAQRSPDILPDPSESHTEPPSPASEVAASRTYECPKCGGRMHFDAEHTHLVCEYCGYTETPESSLAPDRAEKPMVQVMHTAQAHRRASKPQQLECEKCGAITLLQKGQKTTQCPYCGSNQLVISTEIRNLVEPQVIALFKVGKKNALQKARDWLNSGLFAPDDLGKGAKKLRLRPAYYPFWTFDGTVELHWSCQVREGYGKDAYWTHRQGVITDFFDDVLVPGLTALKSKELASIEPFNLKDVVDFDEKHIAGWLTLSYDRSLSDASLLAREKVVRQMRRRAYGKIAPGQEKRNVQIGGGNWSGMTFKHVLLPIWVGTYHYKGEEYHVLVNGQTGKVGGIKPKDPVKVVGIWALVGLGLIALILILSWLAYTYRGLLF